MSHQMICDQCGRGMIRCIERNKTRCYVCLRECDFATNRFYDFDPTGELNLHTDADILLAMRNEAATLLQTEFARKLNITPQYLSDVLKGRWAISPVVSEYYWLNRTTFFVPRFSGDVKR